MYRRWLTETRYYYSHLGQDLLGDWVLTRMWGGRGSRRGRMMRTMVSSLAEGMAMLARVEKARAGHGYWKAD
jgi:hypothetical protein